MKSILQYVVIFLVTSTAAVLLVVLAMTFAPSLFSSGEAVQTSPVDTTTTPELAARPVRPDSVPAVRAAQSVQLQDSLQSLQDTIAALRRAVTLAARQAPVLPAPPAQETTRLDSLERLDSLRQAEARELARIFNAMQAESAARIMGGLSDEDVRAILLAVKQRQAAKILAALEPERAARIIR